MHYDYNGTGVSRQWPIQLVGGNTICLHKQCLAVIRLATLQNIVHKRWAHVHVRTIMLHHDWLGLYKSMRKWCRGAGPSQALLVAYDQATKQRLAVHGKLDNRENNIYYDIKIVRFISRPAPRCCAVTAARDSTPLRQFKVWMFLSKKITLGCGLVVLSVGSGRKLDRNFYDNNTQHSERRRGQLEMGNAARNEADKIFLGQLVKYFLMKTQLLCAWSPLSPGGWC